MPRHGLFVRNLVGDLPAMPYDPANDPPMLTEAEARNLDGRSVRGDGFAQGLDGKPARGDGFAQGLDGKPARGDSFPMGVDTPDPAAIPKNPDGTLKSTGLTEAQMKQIADALGKSIEAIFGPKPQSGGGKTEEKKTIIPGVPDAVLVVAVVLVVLVAAYKVA